MRQITLLTTGVPLPSEPATGAPKVGKAPEPLMVRRLQGGV